MEEKWDKEIEEKEKLIREKVNNWQKLKRFEQIETLKKKWRKNPDSSQDPTIPGDEEDIQDAIKQVQVQNDTWFVWRNR